MPLQSILVKDFGMDRAAKGWLRDSTFEYPYGGGEVVDSSSCPESCCDDGWRGH